MGKRSNSSNHFLLLSPLILLYIQEDDMSDGKHITSTTDRKPTTINSDLTISVRPFNAGPKSRKGTSMATLQIVGGRGHFTRHLRNTAGKWMGTLPEVKRCNPEIAGKVLELRAKNPRTIVLCTYVVAED